MEERSHRHILNLVTQMTITGLSANEIECALIPMMARNISSTMKPNTLTHDQTRYLKLILATHGRSIHWVKGDICSLCDSDKKCCPELILGLVLCLVFVARYSLEEYYAQFT